MPNWVINRLTIEGPNVEKIIKKHITKEEDGRDCFDFETICKMPKELDIEKSSKMADGFKLYIAKINPVISAIGTAEDKMEINDFSNKMIKILGKNAIGKIPMYMLRDNEVEEFKTLYKEGFENVVNLGEKAFNNLEKYGDTDWYNWRIRHWGTKWNSCNTYVSDDKKMICFDTAWSPAISAIEKFASMYPELKITHDYAEEQVAYYCGKLEYENGELASRDDYEQDSKEAYEMYFELWGCEDEFVFDPKLNTYVSKEDAEMEVA